MKNYLNELLATNNRGKFDNSDFDANNISESQGQANQALVSQLEMMAERTRKKNEPDLLTRMRASTYG